MTDDDCVMVSLKGFEGRRVIVTEKMDGENTTMYRNHIHARSVNNRSHESQTWVKQFHDDIAHEIPNGWRICGENMYAKHSIAYDKLPSYFLGFSVWNELNYCLSWDETLEWFALLGITPVPVVYDGIFDELDIREQCLMKIGHMLRHEGYVVRNADAFHYTYFRDNVAKYVRPNHVQTDKHWKYGQPVVKNKLA